MEKNRLESLLISDDISVKEVLKRMDASGEKILFVTSGDGALLGSVTDGDVRRWILREGSLQEPVKSVYNRHPRVVPVDNSIAFVQEVMVNNKLEAIPVVDKTNVVVDIKFWDEVFSTKLKSREKNLKVPVLVMAGGKGTRLDPFTKILPKPLIPVGEKPIIEHIMDEFAQFGCKNFYLTLNYKGKMIQSYFDHAECRYNVHFVWEEKFLGTAGSLKLAMPQIDAPHVFVSNCDILIKADYVDIHNFHVGNNNDITVIGSMQHVSVPFGVIEMKNGGSLEDIVEKPEYDFLANTGMYLVKRSAIEVIPSGIEYNFPNFLKTVKDSGGKVGVYPVSQQSWIDVGQWEEYHNAIKHFGVQE